MKWLFAISLLLSVAMPFIAHAQIDTPNPLPTAVVTAFPEDEPVPSETYAGYIAPVQTFNAQQLQAIPAELDSSDVVLTTVELIMLIIGTVGAGVGAGAGGALAFLLLILRNKTILDLAEKLYMSTPLETRQKITPIVETVNEIAEGLVKMTDGKPNDDDESVPVANNGPLPVFQSKPPISKVDLTDDLG